jgi:hypothetical protein
MGYLCNLLANTPLSISGTTGKYAIRDTLLTYKKDNDTLFVKKNIYSYNDVAFQPGELIKDTTSGNVYVCNFAELPISLEIDVKSGDENTGTLYNILGSIIREGLSTREILSPSSNYPDLTNSSFKLIVNGTFKRVYFS